MRQTKGIAEWLQSHQHLGDALVHLLVVDGASLLPVWGAWIVLNLLLQRGLPGQAFLGNGIPFIYGTVSAASALYALTRYAFPRSQAAGHKVLLVTSSVLLLLAAMVFGALLAASGTNHVASRTLPLWLYGAFLIVGAFHSYFAQAIASFQPPPATESIRRQQLDFFDEFDRKQGS